MKPSLIILFLFFGFVMFSIQTYFLLTLKQDTVTVNSNYDKVLEKIKNQDEELKELERKVNNIIMKQNDKNEDTIVKEVPKVVKNEKYQKKFNIQIQERESDKFWKKRKVKNEYLIIFGMPTIARIKEGEHFKYLKLTCDSLLLEIEKYQEYSNFKFKILVYVLNLDANTEHKVFNEMKNDPKYSEYFKFETISKRFIDPYEDKPGHDYTHPNNIIPGHKARQQTCDVISLEEEIRKKFQFDYIVFMEDDFISCQNSVIEMVRSIAVLESRKPNFCTLMMSYGMNGILLPNQISKNFMEFSKRHILDLPIDNLFFSFINDTPRDVKDKPLSCKFNQNPSITYRTIMWEHLGDVSTFPERNKPNFRAKFPTCNQMSRGMTKECSGNPENLAPC